MSSLLAASVFLMIFYFLLIIVDCLLENMFIDIICRHLHKRKENMSNRKYCLHSYLPILDIWTKNPNSSAL